VEVLPVYIGYDPREKEACAVAKHSTKRCSTWPLFIWELKQEPLRYNGLYKRGYYTDEFGRKFDKVDNKPFSTEFSFTRFLVPALTLYQGWAVFMDGDMLVKGDFRDLLDYRDSSKAVYVVKHSHEPKTHAKMDGQVQSKYDRKNWSSFMLFNCAHPKNRALSPDAVSTETGHWLHNFAWLDDDDIADLPIEWNYLVGYNTKSLCPMPKVIHYTGGGPWFKGYEHVEYASDWVREKNLIAAEDLQHDPEMVSGFTGGK